MWIQSHAAICASRNGGECDCSVLRKQPEASSSEVAPRCPECLSDSRKEGNLVPCRNEWHTQDGAKQPKNDLEQTAERKRVLVELAPQLICHHEKCHGGNDYVICDSCSLEWNYAKPNPVYALADHNSLFRKLMEDGHE